MTTTSAPARTSVAVWFELPANDFERAVAFYETIFATTLRREYFGEDMAIFPYEQPGGRAARGLRAHHLPGRRGAHALRGPDPG